MERIAQWGLAEMIGCVPYPDELFWHSVITYDIPATVAAAIRQMPAHCVGVTLGTHPIAKLDPILDALRAKGLGVKWVECERAMIDAALRGNLVGGDGWGNRCT